MKMSQSFVLSAIRLLNERDSTKTASDGILFWAMRMTIRIQRLYGAMYVCMCIYICIYMSMYV